MTASIVDASFLKTSMKVRNLIESASTIVVSAFFNFVINKVDSSRPNTYGIPLFQKRYLHQVVFNFDVLEKETVVEMIFRTIQYRNRLILELMAGGGMRIGGVLKLRLVDIQDRKLILQEPKIGNENEIVFIPQKVADRLRTYANQHCKGPYDRVFPICYETARAMVARTGRLVGIHLRPHDLRRHAATYASRSGVPIEMVSKVILRHASLATTQRYLGKISDVEAIRWIGGLYA